VKSRRLSGWDSEDEEKLRLPLRWTIGKYMMMWGGWMDGTDSRSSCPMLDFG
jgi:hypothetical protein